MPERSQETVRWALCARAVLDGVTSHILLYGQQTCCCPASGEDGSGQRPACPYETIWHPGFSQTPLSRSYAIRYFTVIILTPGFGLLLTSNFFANQPYFNHMPLDFFTVSSSDEPVTLRPFTLAARQPSEIPVFDAKPPFSEAVTLSPPKLFFVNRR